MKRLAIALFASIFVLLAGRSVLASAYTQLPPDRILLMNNDTRTKGGPVSGQGYYDTNSFSNGKYNETYWVHSKETGLRGVNTNLLLGITHTLFHTNGTTLWHLEHCRAGSGAAADSTKYNYISWSPRYATSIVSPFGSCSATEYAGVGNVSMGNTLLAAIYSPYYTTGIGTIYFDAVNRDIENTVSELSVQIATNANEGVDFSSTNYAGFAWFNCSFDILDLDSESKTVTLSQSNAYSVRLNATEGGKIHSFRMRVPVCNFLNDYHGPIRFRIVRTAIRPGGQEATNFIIVDNILVSYPAMGAELYFDGVYDCTKLGTEVQGRQNMFDIPFLYDGAPEVFPHAYFEPVTNNAFATTATDFEMTNVVFNWRWTYLNQAFSPPDGSWNQIKMEMDENCHTQLVAVAGEQGIPLTNGVGDIEYYMTAEADIPFYSPVDYAWLTIKDSFGKGWSEFASNIVLQADRFFPETGGYEFFTRIRAGYSPWEKFELDAIATDAQGAVATNVVVMELVSSHKWRAYWHMPTNYIGGTLRYRFRGVNWQDPALTNSIPMVNETIYGCATESVLAMPFANTVLANGSLWGAVSPDRISTHLMFELDDETLIYGVSHADYQNFNMWADATEGFKGTLTATSGVASVKQVYPADFSSWGSSSNSNEAVWDEPFKLQKYGGSDYPLDVEFETHPTPNGWTADNGMFVREKYESSVATITGMALQMMGQGKGAMSLLGLKESSQPQGIDTVSFRAHVGQTMGFDDFAYAYYHMSDSSYAVSAQIMMSVIGSEGMTPNSPAISLVANYLPKKGCYEFRMTRVATNILRLELYKWYRDGSKMRNVVLASKDYNNSTYVPGRQLVRTGKDYKNWTSAYLAVYPSGDTCQLTAKVAYESSTLKVENETKWADSVSLSVLDSAASGIDVLKRGTFGVGSMGCSAYFGRILQHPMSNASTPNLISYDSGTMLDEINNDGWALDGRIGLMDLTARAALWDYGLQSGQPVNTVTLSVNESGTSGSAWRSVGTVTIEGFGFANYGITAHTTTNCLVRLSAGGTTDDIRTDVVIDDVHVTSWSGDDRPTRSSGNYGLPTSWVCTDGWLYEVRTPGHTNVCCTLQPTRGDVSYPMSLRSPWIQSGGLSYLVFSYTNVQREASVLVQVATNVTDRAQINRVTESLKEEDWVTVDQYDFNLGDAYRNGGSGTRTSFFSLRAPTTGLVRLIMNPKIIAEALATNDTEYGSLTITSVKVHDEPALDDRAWWGWNLWTTGWRDGVPRERGYLNDSPEGLSGALNFSALLKQNETVGASGITNVVGEWTGKNTGNDLAEPEKAESKNNEYAAHDPFIQGPSLYAGIGKVSFRARCFDASPAKPSVVSLYASKNPARDEWEAAPITNFCVTASSYRLFTWESLDEDTGYRAVRLAVKGASEGRSSTSAEVTPVQRVVIDEIVIAESITPKVAFKDVRPFRTDLDNFIVITNILSADQQPLTAESWGIQATVEPRQMGEDVDRDSIRVYMAYYRGRDKWGAENWTNLSSRVELERVPDTMVWRSIYERPSSIVPADNASGEPVQYFLWAEFRDRNQKPGDKPHKHQITAEEWTTPDWYDPIDYNETYSSIGWSPFTILDTVSPHRAWFNEVNIYDAPKSQYDDCDAKTNQYVEIAVPAGADLTGWRLNLVAGPSKDRLVTMNLATFGYNDCKNAAQKLSPKTNDYAFISIKSPKSTRQADGTWQKVSNSSAYLTDGAFESIYPVGLQLVRKSGVVEHSVVVEGSNTLLNVAGWEYLGSGTNLCQWLLDVDSDKWIFAGADNTPRSVGVVRSHGEYGLFPNNPALNCWAQGTQSPGVWNENQIVPDGWYLHPGGTNVWVYAFATGDHLTQWVGAETNKSLLVILPYGTDTNIEYRVDPWYEIATLKTNSVVIAASSGLEGYYKFELKNVRETVTVEASEAIAHRLTDTYGLTPDNRYTPAVLDWLKRVAPEGGDIKLAAYWDLSNVCQGDFSLTDMYWLNIPPTEGDWVFKAGLTDYVDVNSKAAEPVLYTNKTASGEVILTNVRINVFMMLTNLSSHVCYAPDRLQGLAPGETSYDSASGTQYGAQSPAWTSVTFRVTGALQNGKVNDVFQPLRWFVFGPDSFGAPGSPNEFKARIEITDPFSTGSPAYSKGWSDYAGSQVFYSFSIKGGLEFNTVEMLNSNAVYEVTH